MLINIFRCDEPTVIDADASVMAYDNVIFHKDFGPWKKDEKINFLVIDFSTGVLEEYASSPFDKVVKACCVELSVKHICLQTNV